MASIESLNKNPYKCMENSNFPCYIGNKSHVKAIIVGDSHADAITTGLANVYDLETSGIISLVQSSCPLVINIKSDKYGDKCLIENLKRIEYLKKNHDGVPVFWVARTGSYFYGQSDPKRIKGENDTKPFIYFTKRYDIANKELFNEFSANLNHTIQLIKETHPVYLVLPTPDMIKNIPQELSKSILLKNKHPDLSLPIDSYMKRNKMVRGMLNNLALNNNLRVLDPVPYLCPDGKCIAEYNGRPIYFDSDHMSDFGNKLLTPMFKKALS